MCDNLKIERKIEIISDCKRKSMKWLHIFIMSWTYGGQNDYFLFPLYVRQPLVNRCVHVEISREEPRRREFFAHLSAFLTSNVYIMDNIWMNSTPMKCEPLIIIDGQKRSTNNLINSKIWSKAHEEVSIWLVNVSFYHRLRFGIRYIE